MELGFFGPNSLSRVVESAWVWGSAWFFGKIEKFPNSSEREISFKLSLSIALSKVLELFLVNFECI